MGPSVTAQRCDSCTTLHQSHVAVAGVRKALWCVGGKVGLIDYGQSKQLPDDARIAFAKLVVAMDNEDKPV